MIQKHHYVGGESTHRYTPDTRPKETGLAEAGIFVYIIHKQ